MIRGLRGGLLVNALLALGVVELPPPRREREIDLAAAERAMANLSVVGIDVLKVHELAGGPEDFVAAAEICLANRVMLAEHGRPDVVDAAVLLGRDGNYADPPTLQRLMSGRLARRPPPRDETRDRTMEQLVERSLHPRADDPTIRRCIEYSKTWRFDGLIIVNAYALRSTDPKGLWKVEDPNGPENDAAILGACRESAVTYNGKSIGRVVCGWGANLRNDRRDALAKLLVGVDLSALKVNANGSPAHPLYQRSDVVPRPFTLGGRA